jgi:hypothetical protein
MEGKSNQEHLETAIEVPWVGALKATSGHKRRLSELL